MTYGVDCVGLYGRYEYADTFGRFAEVFKRTDRRHWRIGPGTVSGRA